MKRLAVAVALFALCVPSALADDAPVEKGFESLNSLDKWMGDKRGYVAEDGKIICTKDGHRLYTQEEFSDFIFKFEFKLEEGGNNGIGVWVQPGERPSAKGMEIQILDNSAEKYKNAKPWQFHGSIYKIVPAKRGFQKPLGEWNEQTIIVDDRNVTVILNGETIVDANLDEVKEKGAADGKEHPGMDRGKGHLCFTGHSEHVEFRNIYIKRLD